MSRAHRTLLIATVAAASLVVTAPQAHAAGTDGEKIETDVTENPDGIDLTLEGDLDGDQDEPGDNEDDDAAPGGHPLCQIAPDLPACSPNNGTAAMPACVYDNVGNPTNNPCFAPSCPQVPNSGMDTPGCINTSGRPEISPPSVSAMGDKAVASMYWPDIDPAPVSLENQLILAGFEHSMILWGYQDWEPLTVEASITMTETHNGIAYHETFTATLDATPTQVYWHGGATNEYITGWPLVKTHTWCDNPGNPDFYTGPRLFQDIRYHNNYGGPDCIFTFWGVSDDIGQETTITAEPYWHLILTTHWDDQTHDLGEHSQTYTSEGWWIDATSAVNIIEDATLTITPQTDHQDHDGDEDD